MGSKIRGSHSGGGGAGLQHGWNLLPSWVSVATMGRLGCPERPRSAPMTSWTPKGPPEDPPRTAKDPPGALRDR